MQSVLNVEVSCFKDYNTPNNPVNVGLLSWLQSTKYKVIVDQIRALPTKADRDKLKATLPAITASGTFTRRERGALLKHSGLIAIDVDFKGNETIGNFHQLKVELCNIPNIAYCGVSVSGQGYWCLIPIAHPDKHEYHFKALQDAFKNLGVTIDPACKDVSRLRGYSYDSEGYYNHNATVLARYTEPPKIHYPKSVSKSPFKGDPFQWCVDNGNKAYSFIEGQRHSYVTSLTSFCNLKGIPMDDTMQGCMRFVMVDFTEQEIKKIVTDIYRDQAASHNKSPFASKDNPHPPPTPTPPQTKPPHTPAIPSDYADRVGITMQVLKVGDVYQLNSVPAEQRQQFIDVVKGYIDRNFGKNEGWYLQFSNDWQRIKKFRYKVQ